MTDRKRTFLVVELDVDRFTTNNPDATTRNVSLALGEMASVAAKYGFPMRTRVAIDHFDANTTALALGLPEVRKDDRQAT